MSRKAKASHEARLLIEPLALPRGDGAKHYRTLI
jgi:hypothetical protein